MREFQCYADAMNELNTESRKFLVSLMVAFFYYNVNYNGVQFFSEKDISVIVEYDKCILSLCIRGDGKYQGDIISTQDILEFSMFENIATIKLYCREFDFKDKYNISIMDIIYRLRKNERLSSKLNEDNYNYDIIDKGFDIISAVPRISYGIKYRIADIDGQRVDKEIAEFCDTHNVLDVKTYKGRYDWEKEVVIQYK